MNKDVAINKCLESISTQLGGLSMKQKFVIGSHLYLIHTVGVENALKIVQSKSKGLICIFPSGKEYYYQSIREASRVLKLKRDYIKDTLEGKRSNYKNYKFRYS